MTSRGRFALVFFACVAWFAWMPLGFLTMYWLGAESPRTNPAIPAGWHAAVHDHRVYEEWRLGTVRDSPFEFAGCALLFVCCGVYFVVSGQYYARDEKKRLRERPPMKPWLRIACAALLFIANATLFVSFMIWMIRTSVPG